MPCLGGSGRMGRRPCAVTACEAAAQCPQWDTWLMQWGFISCPGNVRMQALQDSLKLLPQAILCLLEATSSQTSLSATNKESSAYSLFLWPPCVLQRGECSPPPDFLVCSVLPLSSREARGLFVILAVGPKQLMGGLRKNSLWRWRSMASEDQNHFAPASSQVWPFFSNPLGLDFMAEPLQLLPCLCCHLWTHCSTDSSKCMSNLFWGKKQQK